MVSAELISTLVKGYDAKSITIATIGSHSALEIARGAKMEGFRNLVICQKGRDLTYSKYYLARKAKDGTEHGAVDAVTIVDNFKEMAEEGMQRQMQLNHAIFVPNRSFAVYVPYDVIEQKFNVPIFGNRYLLRAEERSAPKNQYYLMEKAGIRMPRKFKSPADIDKLAIIKTPEAKRSYERAFFLAKDEREYESKGKEMLEKGVITKEGLENAVIEEFILGAQFNFNFFVSPLTGEMQLMGIDTRRQTNLDGILRLPAQDQLEVMKHVRLTNIEVGHTTATVRESLLEKAFNAAEKLVETCKHEYPPGIIGPFALQGSIVSEDGKEDLVVFDLSLRVPGSPGIASTPYTYYYYGQRISIGRRIAMEVKQAALENRLQDVVT